MSTAAAARDAYEEAFLGEVARLLPGVDIVRLDDVEERSDGDRDGAPPTLDVLSAAAHGSARRLVDAWSLLFAVSETPASLRLEWASLGRSDVVHPLAVARLVHGDLDADDGAGPHEVIDAEAAAARLRRGGWSTGVRSSSASGFNALGRREGHRLDVVVQVAAGLRTARVTGPAVVAGDLAEPLSAAAPRDVPWPSR